MAWAAVVVLAAGLDVLLAADLRAVRVERRMPRLARRGTTTDGTLVLANDGRRPLRAVARDMWEPSAGQAPRRVRSPFRPVSDGPPVALHPVPPRATATSGVAVRAFGPLGLAARQGVVAAPGELVVTPPFRSRRHLPSRLARLRELDGETTLQLRGHGTEFDSLRDYVRGDDVRSIDWRATARRQDLVVRTWRPERDRRVVIVVDAGRAGAGRVEDEPRLDTSSRRPCWVRCDVRGEVTGWTSSCSTTPSGTGCTGATRSDVVRRFGETLALAEPGLAATDWTAVPGIVDSVTTSRAFVVLVSSLDSVGASATTARGAPPPGPPPCGRGDRVTDPTVERMASGAPERVGRTGRTRRTGVAPPGGSAPERDVYRRAAAERTLLRRDGVGDVARRAGAEVVRGAPEQVPPAVADAYLRAKAAGRL